MQGNGQCSLISSRVSHARASAVERQELDAWLKQQERIPKEFSHVKPEPSVLFKAMHSSAYLVNLAGGAGVKLNVTHFLTAMLTLPYAEAPYLIDKYIGEQGEKFTRLVGEKFPDEEDPEMKELSKLSPLLANESEGGLSDDERDEGIYRKRKFRLR